MPLGTPLQAFHENMSCMYVCDAPCVRPSFVQCIESEHALRPGNGLIPAGNCAFCSIYAR